MTLRLQTSAVELSKKHLQLRQLHQGQPERTGGVIEKKRLKD
jgi:hypothetical protein